MRKKIAVIGCSHSDINQEHMNWIYHLPMNHNVEVDCYSIAGQGNYYQDFVLRYIALNFADTYDAVICQHTGHSRYWVPIGTATELETMRKPPRFEVDGCNRMVFNIHWLYSVDARTWNFKLGDYTGLCSQGDVGTYEVSDMAHTAKQYKDSNRSVVTHHCDMIIDMLPMYANIFKNFFYFGWQWSANNNINMERNVIEEIRHLGGDTALANFLDDTLHLTTPGHKFMYEHYIMKSKIGDYLLDRQ